ncbi:unnamed protein product [Bathycoccus prasinos]
MTTEPPKLERKLTRSDNFGNKYLKAVSLPVAWYDFDTLNPNTVHHEKPLKLTLILIHIVGLAAFVGQCAYHYLDTIKETTVMAKDVDGVKPTVENLVRYGLFGPLVFSGFDGGQPEDSYDGPWNMSTGLRWSINTMTLYHKPFPNLSDVVYTYPSTCIVPFYAGYEKTEKFNPEDGYTSPLEMPLSEAYKRGYDFFNGYGFIGIGNKEPEFDDTCNVNQPWNCGKYVTFHPSSETDYVAQCNGTISEEEQADLFANGTYAFPHVFAQELKWSAPANAQPYVEEGKGDYFVVYKPKTVGITPLYPKTTTLELVTNTASPRTATTFFGKERCNFYEKQIAVEAFEYIFSWPNCHPCSIFKQNSPFFCERDVQKTWLNIFALSISNTLFVMGIMITWAPLLLRVFLGKYG